MNKILFGDSRETIQKLIDDGVRVQTCITSPPYYGLRDYGHEGQIGLEETPDEYIANLVQVFRGVRELLSDDGTLWVNIGDSYAGAASEHKDEGSFGKHSFVAKKTQGGIPTDGRKRRTKNLKDKGIKQKDLIGIPWMLAFALRADGWYLRQDIIWHKPNPMPESVSDRCTRAHEYIFLLSKSPKYYYDNNAIKEDTVTSGKQNSFARKANTCPSQVSPMQHRPEREHIEYSGKRNKRSVWTVSKKPYKGAHSAVFPEELIVDCILASTRKGDIVFDPFIGSGTTASVSIKNQRNYVGCELNEDYKPLQESRINNAVDELAIKLSQPDLFDSKIAL